MQPSTEQLEIIKHVQSSKSNLLVEALAGCAKTTTIVMAAQASKKPGLALAFNVHAKKDLEKRLPPTIKCMTLNGYGHRAWSKTIGKITLEEKKIQNIVDEICPGKEFEERRTIQDLINAARTVGLVHSNAKGSPKVFVPDTTEGWESVCDRFEIEASGSDIDYAREGLGISVNMAYAGVIDFTDQIYMPCCFNGAFENYPLIFVDEAQDLSPLNQFMVRRGARGKVIAVGDSKQAIYAWRGADSTSMDTMRTMFNMDTLYLSTTYRCPKKIVEHVKQHAPRFTAAPEAPAGLLENWSTWNLNDIEEHSAIICRNNAPIISLAFKFFKQNRPVRIVGNNVVEKSICALLKKLDPDDPMGALDTWESQERTAAISKGKFKLVDRIEDRAACCRAALQGRSVKQALEAIRQACMCKTGTMLSTGHRSKGLEWPTVYFLDSELIYSPEGDMSQEANLRYVICTRAQRKLVYLNSKGLVQEEVE